MRRLIINACLTGMIPTKKLNPNTPITPEEIAADAIKCAELGASIVHIHARENDGTPTWKKSIYEKIIGKIRESNTELIVCVSTSGRNWAEFSKRSAVLELKGDLKPDMASLTIGSLNFINQESVNSPEMIERLARKMLDSGIRPELEVFEAGMVNKAAYLISKGILPQKPPYFNILLGSLGTAPLSAASFAAIQSLLPSGSIWSLAGIGAFQLDANIMALSLGGNVRVGLEDNIYFDRDRKVFASNPTLVERIAGLAKTMDIKVSTPLQTRKLLKLLRPV